MEVNLSYSQFLLKLLNEEQNIEIKEYQHELSVNIYLTLLSLSNLTYSEEIDKQEKEEISDFLRKLNNLKVKIQLKRKAEEITELANNLINQYYENINILSIYIKDGIELENVINTMDAKSLTNLIDKVTKDKMNKEDRKEEINNHRLELIKLIPTSNYYIDNDKIYITNDEITKELNINEFIETLSYLLNIDNYPKIYNNKTSQRNHEMVIANAIKLLIMNDKKQEDINKVLIPLILTYISSKEIENIENLNTSDFNIENIKITELYSLASNNQTKEINNTSKWRNISIPNEYLINKLKEMIKKGMYYYKEDSFVLENIEDKTSDFRVSISIDKIKSLLQNILETKIKDNSNSKKNK